MQNTKLADFHLRGGFAEELQTIFLCLLRADTFESSLPIKLEKDAQMMSLEAARIIQLELDSTSML